MTSIPAEHGFEHWDELQNWTLCYKYSIVFDDYKMDVVCSDYGVKRQKKLPKKIINNTMFLPKYKAPRDSRPKYNAEGVSHSVGVLY